MMTTGLMPRFYGLVQLKLKVFTRISLPRPNFDSIVMQLGLLKVSKWV